MSFTVPSCNLSSKNHKHYPNFKHFISLEKPEFNTIENQVIEDNFNSKRCLSFSVNMHAKEKKNEQSIFQIPKKELSEQTIFNKIHYFFKLYFLPNVLGGIFYFLICYVNSFFPCDVTSLIMIIYKIIIKVVFELAFYPIFGYFMLFPWIFSKIRSQNSIRRLKIFIVVTTCILMGAFQLLDTFGFLANYLFLNATSFLAAILFAIWICKRYKIKFADIKEYFLIFGALFVCLNFDYYIIKAEIIVAAIEIGLYKKNEILFKFILFLYFNIYNAFVNFLMVRFFKICNLDNNHNNNDGMLVFLKYFISDLMCSTLIPIVFLSPDAFSAVLNIIVFSYQLSIFYFRENLFIKYIKTFIFYLFKMPAAKKDKDDHDMEFKCHILISTSLNEIMIILYLKIIFLSNLKQFLIGSPFVRKFTDLCLRFPVDFNLDFHILLLIFMINILIAGTVLFSKRKIMSHNQFVKNDQFSLLKQTYPLSCYYDILLCGIVL